MAPIPLELILPEILVFVLGLCIGSFLNVLALRTLEGKSVVWPPSACPGCGKAIAAFDNIPVLSYLILKGRCRHCQGPISWQYPLVELITAVFCVAVTIAFGFTLYAAGMVIFGCTLIAVTVTDFREKLIPHDITYPSMLVGLGFSAYLRNDLLGAMAGVGASYIIFDFLAHYGLKIYMAVYSSRDEESPGSVPSDPALDRALDLPDEQASAREMEEFEVMGGGDAVLSAVISAWLGWQRLVVALLVGFVIGTVMGTIYLIAEMRKANILHQCYRPAAAGAILGFALLTLPLILLGLSLGVGVGDMPWQLLGAAGAIAGCLLGIVSVGTRVSKPFPFGPALAAGGAAAIFWNPLGAVWPGGA